jgi:hypothetical protein
MDAPVAVYDVRRALMIFIIIGMTPILIAFLIEINYAFSDPKLDPFVSIGLSLSVPIGWMFFYVFLRFLLPRVEFYEGFARCFRGFARANDVPYAQMRLTFESVRGVSRRRCLIWDMRQPFLAPYPITRATVKSLNMPLFDWLEDKVQYGGLHSSDAV